MLNDSEVFGSYGTVFKFLSFQVKLENFFYNVT